MIQGPSVGGEASVEIFLVERAPPGRRGLVGSMASLAANGGFLMGSAIGALFAALLPADALAAWGWRIPFLLGLLVGVVGWWIRRYLEDDPPRPAPATSPIVDTLRHHGRLVAHVAGVAIFNAVGFYLMFLPVGAFMGVRRRTETPSSSRFFVR